MLTRNWFDLSWMLASQVGRLVFQAMILRRIWGAADADDSQYLRVCIRQLRTRIGADATNPHTIFTKPGLGYRFFIS